MSRKGKLPIAIPKGVEVKITAESITIKGPKGSLQQDLVQGVNVVQEGENILVSLDEKAQNKDNFHGLYRTIIHNMVQGTTVGFEKKLEMIGVGYRAAVSGHLLDLQVGVSHPMKLTIPEGVQVKVEKNTAIFISGIDKQKIGQFAAIVRAVRPPEPYQGKGIRYSGEHVRKKAGKAAAKK